MVTKRKEPVRVELASKDATVWSSATYDLEYEVFQSGALDLVGARKALDAANKVLTKYETRPGTKRPIVSQAKEATSLLDQVIKKARKVVRK